MKLYIFRHGLAMDRSESMAKKIQDADRPLIEKGKNKTLKMAKYLYQRDSDVEVIVTSPYLRARETADILATVFALENKILECPELVPSAPPQAFQQWLKRNASEMTNMIVVGHEPHLTTFCSWASAGTTIGFIELRKSGIISLELESLSELHERSAQIKWIVQPASVLK